jgi:hypothetical protein
LRESDCCNLLAGKKKAGLMASLQKQYCHKTTLTFCVGFQTARADIFANFTTIFVEGHSLNIRPELSFSLFLREAYIVAGHRSLAANLTFSHNFTLS